MDLQKIISALRAGETVEAVVEREQLDLAQVTRELATLAHNGVDWARKPRRGRPPKPLLCGQQAYILAAYTRTPNVALADISLRVRVSLPRVKRVLTEMGVFRSSEPIDGADRRTRLLSAVGGYLSGEKVTAIHTRTEITPSELYKALRARGITLRSQTHQGGHYGADALSPTVVVDADADADEPAPVHDDILRAGTGPTTAADPSVE